jgi:hypothetical protein
LKKNRKIGLRLIPEIQYYKHTILDFGSLTFDCCADFILLVLLAQVREQLGLGLPQEQALHLAQQMVEMRLQLLFLQTSDSLPTAPNQRYL